MSSPYASYHADIHNRFGIWCACSLEHDDIIPLWCVPLEDIDRMIRELPEYQLSPMDLLDYTVSQFQQLCLYSRRWDSQRLKTLTGGAIQWL